MNLPTGYDIFGQLIEHKLDFVDKTLFIKDLLDDETTAVSVITRPRRFGKTLNLTMLHYFFSPECYGIKTAGMFNNLKIAKIDGGKYLKEHQGKYPVIFMTLKGLNENNFQAAYDQYVSLLAHAYRTHRYLVESPTLDSAQQSIFQAIINQTAPLKEVENALQNLSEYLFLHHGVKPWLLIDEYDTPLQAAYLKGYYEEMVEFLRHIFGAAFKTNPYLNRAVVTGILRIAKESLFSGVNNLKVYSILNNKYSQYFGFTESEVDDLLTQSQLATSASEIKTWYNGYQFGNTTVYNPWSIANCLNEKGLLRAYWVNTSGNDLIQKTIIHSDEDFKTKFETLIAGDLLTVTIDENLVFGDLLKEGQASWSLLLMAGYLKPVSQTMDGTRIHCQVSIPNREVRSLYKEIFEDWLSIQKDNQWYNQFLEYLLTGQLEDFAEEFKDLLERTVSYHDTAQNPEAFYHGLMIGLTATLHYKSDYQIRSNRESGKGRYDYLILSKNPSRPSLVIEIKRVKREKLSHKKLLQKLKETAQAGLEQILVKQYATQAKQESTAPVIQFSLAFCGKEFEWCSSAD
jgi:hypothetical protein